MTALPGPLSEPPVPLPPTSGAIGRPLPRTGIPAVDEWGLFRPGALTVIESWGGVSSAHALFLRLVVGVVADGHDVAVVDGGNSMEVYHLARAAEAAGVPAEHALRCVRVARGFTAYQLQSLVEDRLPPEAADERVGLVAVAAFPDMYLDEDVAPSEGRILAARAMATLARVAGERQVPAVVTLNGLPQVRGARRLREIVHERADEIVGVSTAGAGAMRLALVTRGAQVLAPASRRQRTLGDFADVRPDGEAPDGMASRRVRPPLWAMGYLREGRVV